MNKTTCPLNNVKKKTHRFYDMATSTTLLSLDHDHTLIVLGNLRLIKHAKIGCC